MSIPKNNMNTAPGNKGSEIQNDALRNENPHPHTHEGKRSGFNEDADLVNNPPGRKHNPVAPGSAGDENYEDEETEDDDYYEKVHQKNLENENRKSKEDYKEPGGYGDPSILDKP